MLLICWPKKDFFGGETHYKMFATHRARDLSSKGTCFNTISVSGATVTLQVESD